MVCNSPDSEVFKADCHVYPVVPPKVEYSLTPLGKTLTELLRAICKWAEVHLDEIDVARRGYDNRTDG